MHGVKHAPRFAPETLTFETVDAGHLHAAELHLNEQGNFLGNRRYASLDRIQYERVLVDVAEYFPLTCLPTNFLELASLTQRVQLIKISVNEYLTGKAGKAHQILRFGAARYVQDHLHGLKLNHVLRHGTAIFGVLERCVALDQGGVS